MAERIYNAKQCYRCTECGNRTYSMNGDNDPHFKKWLQIHNKGNCLKTRKPVTIREGTEAEGMAAWKAGKLKGAWFDRHGGRSTRFSWEEYD